MPKHTARRGQSEGDFPSFEAIKEEDVNAAAEGRTTELYDHFLNLVKLMQELLLRVVIEEVGVLRIWKML